MERQSTRELNRRRIAWTTRGLAAAAAVATAIFAAAAAHTTGAARTGDSTLVQPSGEQEDDDFVLSPAQSVPQTSFSTPVATSGGS